MKHTAVGPGRKVRPIGGWQPSWPSGTIAMMLWIIVLVAIAPLVSLFAERHAALIPIEPRR